LTGIFFCNLTGNKTVNPPEEGTIIAGFRDGLDEENFGH
jgi:hypothetical protein